MPPAQQLALPLEFVAAESDLVALALALGARSVPGWSDEEEALAGTVDADDLPPELVTRALSAIERGEDPLGEAFCRLFSPADRRALGATYTPQPIVASMIEWAKRHSAGTYVARVVDPGTGSARFLVAAGRAFPEAELLGCEVDPLAAVIARGHLAAAGIADRCHITLRDYRQLDLPEIAGSTLFVGNPPYVRHHLIEKEWKEWLDETARRYGLRASKLAGLHVHFFLRTAELARHGDIGTFITAAEWLDVNYGQLVRDLLVNVIGLTGVHLIEPTALPFEEAQTTAVITTFEAATRPNSIGLRRIANGTRLDALDTTRRIPRERLAEAARWTPLTRSTAARPSSFVELGEICRVHRGQVTGANKVWIAGAHSEGLPESVLFPSITRARELFEAGAVLQTTDHLRRVIDLPEDLDRLDPDARLSVDRFLEWARSLGTDGGYIARHRRAWWSVGLREPAPILATYMARRTPAFVVNAARARHINIAHGLYPRDALSLTALQNLARFLSTTTTNGQGRTYAGGLTKFEPREMERLMVPPPEVLIDSEHLRSTVAELKT